MHLQPGDTLCGQTISDGEIKGVRPTGPLSSGLIAIFRKCSNSFALVSLNGTPIIR
jgi:hypothetical protein